MPKYSSLTARTLAASLIFASLAAVVTADDQAAPRRDSSAQRDARMAWWREARFGMFIHWGLYSIPAGEWKGKTNHAEWIRTTAQIPIDEYDKFVGQFNPVKFDADAWVKMAKDAGMKYVVITSKHHDGFCLWDSPSTDFDVMSTPFKRDILAELEAACRRAGDIRFCVYHSIMDWHHPDYLPRRDWEKGQRSAEGAQFDRYVAHLKDQLKELVTGYNPGVIWFDGEWEETWTHAYGGPLYDYVRGLNPEIIINNRVDKGRGGMAGLTSGDHAGDFGTPEQEIPATGFPGVDWESCMTMNDNWGYNSHDKHFKSTQEIIRMLVDIASKGGNLLLNIGPMSNGEFPTESVQRLAEVGKWMEKNGKSIYGTQAGPFKSLPWGRATLRYEPTARVTGTLYLHVFDWPKDGRLVVPGLLNQLIGASLLSSGQALDVKQDGETAVIAVPANAPDAEDSVVVLNFYDHANVAEAPVLSAKHSVFVETQSVEIKTSMAGVEVRYTLDGSEPTEKSSLVSGPVSFSKTTTVKARNFVGGKPVGPLAEATFTKISPRKPEVALDKIKELKPGLAFDYFEGDWKKLPDFGKLKPVKSGGVATFDVSPRNEKEHFGFRYSGMIRVPSEGVYTLSLESDDGSRLWIGDQLVVDNDGLHSAVEKTGDVALAPGAHAIRVEYFECTGDDALAVYITGPDGKRAPIAAEALFHKP